MRLFLFFVVLSSTHLFGQANFKFDKTTLKLPKTKEGEVVRFEYSFTNDGNQPLIINEIKVACSCTKFEFPKEPIKPGEKAVIKVSFDTKDKIGFQDRTLDIYSNAKKNPFKIRFKIMVDNKK